MEAINGLDIRGRHQTGRLASAQRRARRCPVIRQSLAGRCILIVEDEPLVALHIIDAVKRAGAIVRVTYSLGEAAVLVEADDLSAAILDYRVGDGDSSLLCQRLGERGVPFLIYSGYTEFSGACRDAPRLPKATTDATLVAALEGLLERSP